jgi:Haem-binding domain
MMPMSLWIKRLVPAFIGLLLLIQLIRPSMVNPPTDSKQEIAVHLTVESRVQSIFDRSCNDCHSNHTVWPWYSHVAPVSWLVASDVNNGRRHLNFSEWGTYPTEKRSKILQDICNEVQKGDMPPFQYTPMHRASKLTTADQEEICRWTVTARQRLVASDRARTP